MRGAFLVLVACFSSSQSLACGSGENAFDVKKGGEVITSVTAEMGEVHLSRPFGIKFFDCDGIFPVEADLRIDAIMPAHQHGMNYSPQVTRPQKDMISVSGMVFHMPGHWVIELAVLGDTASRYTVDYHLK